MYYTYILRSTKDHKLYTGATDDLRKRFIEHTKGMVRSTKGRGPFQIVYYEACLNKSDAFYREKYLKSGYGKRYLKNRLKRFLSLTGYTMIEILVTIAIIGIMVAIATFGYAYSKNYDLLLGNTDRLASVLRNARTRDFNGVLASQGAALAYPLGGYGVHFDDNYKVCNYVNDVKKSCVVDVDCDNAAHPGATCTGGNSNKAHFVIYADFNNDGHYNGGKNVAPYEFIEEYILPKNFSFDLPVGYQKDLIFQNNTLYESQFSGSTWSPKTILASDYAVNIMYGASGTCSPSVKNKKGNVTVRWQTNQIEEQFAACP